MAALLRHGARRVGGSVVQRTRAAFTTPAAAEEQRLLTTEQHARLASTTTGVNVKKRWELSCPAKAYLLVLGLVVCPLVLRKMTQTDGYKEWAPPI